MNSILRSSFLLVLLMLCGSIAFGQTDSSISKKEAAVKPVPSKKKKNTVDSTFSIRKAVIRSAIIPGWGQVYNKKLWKVPIVYAALGTTTALFFRNLKQYREARNAYRLAVDEDPTNDFLIPQPYFNVKDQPERIRSFRNDVRQNIDYSVLFFIVFWGLNVADAAVDAHLKSFDVSDNLSLHIKPGYSPLAGTNGVSLVMAF